MNLREAMDVLSVSSVELGERLDVPPQSVRQARLDPQKDGYRPPPDGWRDVLADIARKRLPEMKRVLEELEGEGSQS